MIYPLKSAEESIISVLQKALDDLKIDCEIKLEKPPEDIADFAFPCFSLAPISKKSPKIIAEEIVKILKNDAWIKEKKAVNGYINFNIDQDELIQKTFEIIDIKKEKYGFLEKNNKKVIIEHTSANPNGPLHVGRARNPIIGDTIYRLFKAAGFNAESQFYLDDMGKQVAILAWGINNLNPEEIPVSDIDKEDHKKVGYYQLAYEKMQNDFYISDEINELIKKGEEGDPDVINSIHDAYAPVLEGMKQSLDKINIKIDSYIPESTFVLDKSVEYVIENLKKTPHSESEGKAFYIDMAPYGVKGRNTKFFYLRKDGTTLYATRDIAYHIWKSKRADLLVNILGEDHKLESQQVKIALELLKIKNIPKAIFYSFVSMPGGKMSTRMGRVVYLDGLINECIKRAYEEVKKRRGNELDEKQMREIAEKIGLGALRFNIIKVQPEKDIVFKWEEALNFEGNSAPFIQYSHARACSILSKTTEKYDAVKKHSLNNDSEIALIKKIAEFPLIIEQACLGYKPHSIANYLLDIASKFNQFYRDCPVLSEEDDDLRKIRLSLVNTSRIVVRNGLEILGIEAPKEM